MRKASAPVSLALFALIAAGALFAAPPASLKAILEMGNQANYAGDPVLVRTSIWNDGDTDVESPGGDVPSGFELYDGEGKQVARGCHGGYRFKFWNTHNQNTQCD